MKLKSRGGKMIRTFLSWIVLTVIYVGAFGLVLSEVFYLVAEINNARSVQLVEQVRAGVGISWNWVRTDNWGIETFFFVTEVFILGGAIWLYQQGKLRTKLTRKAAKNINAYASDARAAARTFVEAFDKTDFTGLDGKLWRSETPTNLGQFHSKLRNKVRQLKSNIPLEQARFSPNSDAEIQIHEYATFVAKLDYAIDNFRNICRTFVPEMKKQRSNFLKFANYKFSLHNRVPDWFPPLPANAGADLSHHADLGIEQDVKPQNVPVGAFSEEQVQKEFE